MKFEGEIKIARREFQQRFMARAKSTEPGVRISSRRRTRRSVVGRVVCTDEIGDGNG